MNNNKVALKIVGIIACIIVGCTLLAIFVGAPLLRNLQYTNALKNAENGQYIAAIKELSARNMDEYKDTKLKKQEYAMEAAREFIKDKDKENAVAMLEYVIELDVDTKLTTDAKILLSGLVK